MTKPFVKNNIEEMPLHEFVQMAYMNYASYVIKDRALPSIGDGLKPVQRRIVYAMSELGLSTKAKYKKSARTVGDVLGKYHPHGDTACYEAMVHMAQPFSYRYTILDGQGNWGAQEDPKSFAAMRYTEARLSKYADILLSEIDKNTIKWQPNFDGTLNEPTELPARLPNILLNGTTGIAVGMATDIPPHNINEVVEACINLIDNPNMNEEEICKYIKGPDFPTGGEIITPKKEIINTYKKGNGTIRVRATYKLEKNAIVIKTLPYQVSSSKIIEQISDQISNKKLPMVLNIRDESDHETPIRLVIQLEKNTKSTSKLISHLFATTELEKTIRINMNVIDLSGKPGIKNLVELLKEWILFREKTIEKRIKYRFNQVKVSLENFEGLLIAHLNASEIIYIIQNKDNPKKKIKEKLKLTDQQVEYILELKLRKLAHLEKRKIISEQKKLRQEKKYLEKILRSKLELKIILKEELRNDTINYGDKRLTKIIFREKSRAFSRKDIAPNEPITIILSKNGWSRTAKGHRINCKNISYKPGDKYLDTDIGFSNDLALFFNSSGRIYTLHPHTLPSIRSYGEPLTSRFETPEESIFNSVTLCSKNKTQLLVSSTSGHGFVTKLGTVFTTSAKGRATLALNEKMKALPIIKIRNIKTELLAAFTNSGRLLLSKLSELPILTKGKGSKIIHTEHQKEHVTILKLVLPKESLVVFSGKQHLIINEKKKNFYLGKKGNTGKKLPRGFQKVSRVEIQTKK